MATSWTKFSLPDSIVERLPRLRWLLERAVLAEESARSLTYRLADLGHILSRNRTPSRLPHIAELQEEVARHELRAQESWGEIEALGAVVSDRQLGMVDFPLVVDGRAIVLCFQYGEESVSHWHEVSEPCAARKPIGASGLTGDTRH